MIGQSVSSNCDAPRNGFIGDVVDSPPDNQQRLGEDISSIIGQSAATQIALQRLEDSSGDFFESPSRIDIQIEGSAAHKRSVSGTDVILSGEFHPFCETAPVTLKVRRFRRMDVREVTSSQETPIDRRY